MLKYYNQYKIYMSQTTVNLTPEHRKLIDEKCLNLSRFLRTKLDEEFGITSEKMGEKKLVVEQKIPFNRGNNTSD